MMGLQVDVKTGMNHIEFIETLLHEFSIVLKKIVGRGGMATPDEMVGMQNLAQHIEAHIQILAQDPEQKARVKEYMTDLGKIMNEVKALGQRLQERMKAKQEQQGGQIDPKDRAKVAAMMIQAKAKEANTRESHAQRTAQRQTQFEMKLVQDQREHQQKLAQQAQEHGLELQKEVLKHRMNKMKAFSE